MTKKFLSCCFLLLPFLFLIQTGSSKADNVAVYWCWNGDDGNLTETCATGKYSIIVIASLQSTLKLNLRPDDQCDPSSSWCTTIGTGIKYCQKQGIKVMLYVAGDGWNDTLSSSKAAQNISEYLWNNFLGGSSSSRPFGDAILDGIDVDIRYPTPYWEDLARYLKSHSTDSQKVYLSACPPCRFPDYFLGTALETKGLFDYVFIQFRNDPTCDYSVDNPDNFINAWTQWTRSLNGSTIFPYLQVSKEEVSSGYVPPDLLTSEVLPVVRKSPNYGGVMLWQRYEDESSGYSTYIQISPLCTPQGAPKCRNHDSGFEERFGYMSSDSIKVYKTENLGPKCCEIICRNNCSCDAFAPVNQVDNTGCQIWGKGTVFIEAAGSDALSIFVVRHKGMSSFLT